MKRIEINHVAVWARPDVPPDEISNRFWNMLLVQGDWTDHVFRLLNMFAALPPQGTGRYHHHDGYRPT